MTSTSCAWSWAHDTFSELAGDTRWGKRLVRIAVAAALRPAGQVTRVMAKCAEREATFRLLENRRISAAAVGATCFDACARHCQDQDVYVAIDGTSLSFTDRGGIRGLGGVG